MSQHEALSIGDRFEIFEQLNLHQRCIDNERKRKARSPRARTSDKFEKRGGRWKCLERVSNVDPNWPAALFQPFVDNEKTTFRDS
jgi:hypothetical protein